MLKLNDEQEIRQVGNLELLARQVVEGFVTGLHQSPFHGFSVRCAGGRQSAHQPALLPVA